VVHFSHVVHFSIADPGAVLGCRHHLAPLLSEKSSEALGGELEVAAVFDGERIEIGVPA
jgi:hypothetical protein